MHTKIKQMNMTWNCTHLITKTANNSIFMFSSHLSVGMIVYRLGISERNAIDGNKIISVVDVIFFGTRRKEDWSIPFLDLRGDFVRVWIEIPGLKKYFRTRLF